MNFLNIFQVISAIPRSLKETGQEIAVTKRDLQLHVLKEQEVFYFFDNS